MSSTIGQSQTTVPTDAAVQEFRAKVLGLLNSSWPHRSEVDNDTAKRAQALAVQLQNWDTWK